MKAKAARKTAHRPRPARKAVRAKKTRMPAPATRKRAVRPEETHPEAQAEIIAAVIERPAEFVLELEPQADLAQVFALVNADEEA